MIATNNVSNLVFIMRELTQNFIFHDTVTKLDYDKTLADKLNPNDADDTPLTEKHHSNLNELGGMIHHNYIVTTRGAESVHNYWVNQYGPVDNSSIAADAGFWLTRFGSSEVEHIPVPGYTADKLNAVVAAIKNIPLKLEDEFSKSEKELGLPRDQWPIRADVRELCATALVALTPEQFAAYQKRQEELIKETEEAYSCKIVSPSKFWVKNGKEMGYTDFKPMNLEKEFSVTALLEREDKSVAYGIGGGDSDPDYGIYAALKKRFGKDEALCFALGEDLPKYEKEKLGIDPKDSIIDVVIISDGKHSPVEMFHMALECIHSPVKMLQMAIKEAPFRENGSNLKSPVMGYKLT